MDDDAPITDAELTALALAADPDAPLDADAVPLRSVDEGGRADCALPAWYMPAAVAGTSRRKRVVIGVLIGAFVVVNAAGLCVTYGIPEIAW